MCATPNEAGSSSIRRGTMDMARQIWASHGCLEVSGPRFCGLACVCGTVICVLVLENAAIGRHVSHESGFSASHASIPTTEAGWYTGWGTGEKSRRKQETAHEQLSWPCAPLTPGFGKDFFDAYHSINPKSQPYYDERQKLYELYHHLNVSSSEGGSELTCSTRSCLAGTDRALSALCGLCLRGRTAWSNLAYSHRSKACILQRCAESY